MILVFFKNSFTHNSTQQSVLLQEKTCTNENSLTNFFLPPLFNSFVAIQITDSNDVPQVNKLVEMAQREDDEDMCLQVSDTDTSCDPCLREFRGKISNSLGIGNNIIVSCFPATLNVNDFIIENIGSCSIAGAIGSRPVLSIITE